MLPIIMCAIISILPRYVSRITDASGTGSSSDTSSGEGALVPEVMRYVSAMRLTFKIRDGEPETIYPPILEVGVLRHRV